ncbi:MAG: ArnT family glycosyltransferase [Nitrospinota bacterium]
MGTFHSGPGALTRSRESPEQSAKRDLILLISVFFVVKLVYSALIDLTPDEAYYWSWSNHLDLSYYDHPPMVAYLISLTTFFGYFDSPVMVRLGALLMGSGISIVVYKMASTVFKSFRAGFWAVVWLNLSLLFSLGASIITPDTPQAFFSILFIYFFYRTLFESLQDGFLWSGVFLGFALLSKYSAFLFIPAASLFLMLSRQHRPLLRKKEVYLMFLISLLLFSPVLLWNYSQNWASFQFQVSHGLLSKSSHNSLLGFLELLGTQLLLITPFLFFLLFVSAFYGWQRGKEEPVFLYLFCMSVPVLLFFFLVSFKTKIEGNWPSQGYLALIVLSGGVTAGFQRIFLSDKNVNLFRKLKWASVATASIIVFLAHLLAAAPPKFIVKKTSIAKRILGWKDLGEKVTMLMTNAEFNPAFVITNGHQVSSEIEFYAEGSFEVFQTGEHYRYPYLKSSLRRQNGKNALYLSGDRERNQIGHIKKFFETVQELEPETVKRKGESVRGYKVYKCLNFRGGLL